MLGQDHTEMEKTMITRRSLLSGTTAAGLSMSGISFAHGQSQAQSYPDRPIKVILPYTAGPPTT
jgi:tripartite-type tricarboxylate transporter receptor subunit TctC